MGLKTKKRPQHNARKGISFKQRYGMSKREWFEWKNQMRRQGKGAEIDKKIKKAQRKIYA